MKYAVFIILLIFSAVAQAAAPFARISTEDSGEIIPGQQMHVLVDVFVPDFFTSPPQFPLFELTDALVTIPAQKAQNLVQTIDGVQYSGIRQTYAIVPEQSGDYTVPALSINLSYSVNGTSTKALVVTSVLNFTVADITANNSRVAFAARNLTLTQTLDQDPSALKTGDALSRTIVILAEDTQAMLIPPLDIGLVSGLRQYVKPAILHDNIQIGRRSGSSRTETIIYTADSEGEFEIPVVAFPWFDIDAKTQQTSSLAAVKVVVTAAPATESIIPELPPEAGQKRNSHRPIAIATVALALLAVAVWALRAPLKRLLSAITTWFPKPGSSRRVRLQKLRATVQTGKDSDIFAALEGWSQSLGFRSISEWVGSRKSADLCAQVDILQRRLFRSEDMPLDRNLLAELVGIQAARPLLHAPSKLPELNPRFDE